MASPVFDPMVAAPNVANGNSRSVPDDDDDVSMIAQTADLDEFMQGKKPLPPLLRRWRRMGIYMLQKVAIAKTMAALRPPQAPASVNNESGYPVMPKEGVVLTAEQLACSHPKMCVAFGKNRYAKYAFCKKCEVQFYFEHRTDTEAGREQILKKQLRQEMKERLERARRYNGPPRTYPESGLQGVQAQQRTFLTTDGHVISHEEYRAMCGDLNDMSLRDLRVDMRSGDYFARRGPLPRPAPSQEQPSSHRGPVVRGETAPRSSSKRRSVEGRQEQVLEQANALPEAQSNFENSLAKMGESLSRAMTAPMETLALSVQASMDMQRRTAEAQMEMQRQQTEMSQQNHLQLTTTMYTMMAQTDQNMQNLAGHLSTVLGNHTPVAPETSPPASSHAEASTTLGWAGAPTTLGPPQQNPTPALGAPPAHAALTDRNL